jgi:hypothetical protein
MKGPERPCYIEPQQTSSRNVLQRSVEPAAISGRSTPISTAAIVTKCAVEARNEGFHSDSAALPDALINLAIGDAIAREESSCRKCFPETTS